MKIALTGGRVLLPSGWADAAAVIIEGDRIHGIVPAASIPADVEETRDLGGAYLLPGFIDVQVNGGGGVMFNDAPTAAALAQIVDAHRAFGTTGMLPTLISDDMAVIQAAMATVADAMARKVPGILGLHVEGPFINPQKKGIHDAAKLCELDAETLALFATFRAGKLLVTLAPEQTDSAYLRQLADSGAIVCAGHTNATYREMQAALKGGLTGFTHLFNAMSPLQTREPGAVGAALESQHSWCGIIVDGRHVDPVLLRIALKCKPAGKLMLVTDAMAAVGSDLESFSFQGREIRVEGETCIDADGVLAGSNLTMIGAVRNCVALLGLELAEAVRMASQYPAEFLGLGNELGRIAPGYRADLVMVDETLNVLQTWVGGVPVFSRR